MSRIGASVETENGLVVAQVLGDGGWGSGGQWQVGAYGVSSWGDENVLEWTVVMATLVTRPIPLNHPL